MSKFKEFWNNPVEVRGPNVNLRFVPERATLRNPEDWRDTKARQFGRVIVGFNVGDTPTWTLDDLEREWHEFAATRKFPRDCTIVPQRGAFTMADGTVVQENGATLTVLNIRDRIDPAHFANTLMAFGEDLADAFKQESVIVQLGRGSRTYITYGMRAFTDAELRRAAKRRGMALGRRKAKGGKS